MGLLLGLDPLVAQAFGARRLDECHRWLVAGVWLGVLASRCRWCGVMFCDQRLAAAAGACRRTSSRWRSRISRSLTWSLPPLLLYVAFRRYLQAMNIVRPVMLHAGRRQHGQRGRELGPDHRGLRRSGAGRARRRHTRRCRRAIFMAGGCWSSSSATSAHTTPRLLETRSRSTWRGCAGWSRSGSRRRRRWCSRSASSPPPPRSPGAFGRRHWRRTRSRSTWRR